MLTCIARPKKLGGDSASQGDDPSSRGGQQHQQGANPKSLTSQIKEMALKASGAYRQCTPCAAAAATSGASRGGAGESDSEWSSRRRRWGKEMEARLKGMSSGEGTPSSSGPQGGGAARRRRRAQGVGRAGRARRFDHLRVAPAWREPSQTDTIQKWNLDWNSREIFNKWQAQRWWAENYDKVMELYNVQRLNRQAFPLPTPPRSEDESSKRESIEEIPVTPPLSRERPPCNLYRAGGGMGMGMGMGYSSSDSFDHQSMQSRHYYDPNGVNSTPKVSTISAAKTDISSMDADASIRSSTSREADRSGDLSISNASDLDTEWVEQDEPGVYITLRALPGGKKELRRVRFSREKFGEMHARLWWGENRARIHEQYL
ncbi:Brevis radix 4 [Spatholobus suberectus]|nr:Brevis radix 4 [Spatholobus suberectus]